MNKKRCKRFLTFLLCFSLLLGAFAYRPQKTEAVALSATAAAVSVVAAVLTAAGVNYWASSQGDAISYLSSQLSTYISWAEGAALEITEWLGIDDISDLIFALNGGAIRIPREQGVKILDFVEWFLANNNISSGSVPVGVQTLPNGFEVSYGGEGFGGNWTVEVAGENTIKVIMSQFTKPAVNNAFMYVNIPAVAGQKISAKVGTMVGSHPSQWKLGNYGPYGFVEGIEYSVTATEDNVYLTFIVTNIGDIVKNGSVLFEVNTGVDFSFSYSAKVTPSAEVALPLTPSQNSDLMIQTNADITSDFTADQAAEAIVEQVLDVDGLDSEQIFEEPAASEDWTWLQTAINNITTVINDAKQAILGLPAAIATAIGNLFVPSEEYVDTFVSSLYSTFDNHFSILSYPFSLLGTFVTKVGTIGSAEPIFTWPNIYEPFSNRLIISAGSYNLNNALQNQTFNYMHQLYMIVIKGILSFQFVTFLYAWFCDVFHMRNSDYDNPLDEEDSG